MTTHLQATRRSFIRVISASSLASPLALLGACSTQSATQSTTHSEFPADTVEAWAGPSAQAANIDPRRTALAYAILAPNPHNRQPWLVDLREPETLTLYCDRTRLLPETDPFGRQILIGHGAFIELLVQALAQTGLASQVTLFPQGEFPPTLAAWQDLPVARITLTPGAAPDPLFAQVLNRRTPKVDFDVAQPVTEATLTALTTSSNPSLAAGHASKGTIATPLRDTLRTLCWESAKVELLTERTVMETIHLIRVGPTEIRQHRDGIALNSPMVRALEAVGLFDRSAPPANGSPAYKNMMARFEGHSNSAMGFVWLTSQTNARADQVNAGRAYLRLQLQATALGVGMHPMSQCLQEFAEMKPFYDQAHDMLLGKDRPVGATVQMLCRIGYTPKPVGATPRRGVEGFVRV